MTEAEPLWQADRRRWGWADTVALGLWSLAITAFFWDVVSLRRALFYFDITELNYPYRAFFARELRAGRFSRWCPGVHCGLPLYSESQAGYLHPLKYLLYPWLATWQALNLDTVLSIWLTGLGAYGWLRRHVGPAGALTGAAVLGLSGFTWGHLIHTSWINALPAVPFAFWALESAWEGRRGRGIVAGALAIASAVFAGQMQCALLTSLALLVYAAYRAALGQGIAGRARTLATAVALLALGVGIAAVQWVPLLELLGRSARSGGLSWDELTFGSWSPELLPELLLREAYGTRARDTDWLDGFYQYHEMDAYAGAVVLVLALLGGAAYRDRWAGFWVLLCALGGTLMLGRFTFLFDLAHRVPILGSTRIPMRFQLWVSLGLSALAAVGVDRLGRPGRVRLRPALLAVLGLVAVSVPILVYDYAPIWTEPGRWSQPADRLHFRWLAGEWIASATRTVALAGAGLGLVSWAARSTQSHVRKAVAGLLPLLVIGDLLAAHWVDVPSVTPDYWTAAPVSARRLQADARLVRLVGVARYSAGEPGYASHPVDFLAVRDTLDWSLPLAWGLTSAAGASPVVPRRMLEFNEQTRAERTGLDLQGVTHVVTARSGQPSAGGGVPVGSAVIHANPRALPRARLVGRPVYAHDQTEAAALVRRLGPSLRDRPVVEDPTRPLPEDADAQGSAVLVRDLPEHVRITTRSATASYLVLADAFDPGWSATVDGRPAPIRPADLAFRAVYLPAGNHAVDFRYRPSGFLPGLVVTLGSLALALGLAVQPGGPGSPETDHGPLPWPARWPLAVLGLVAALVAVSIPRVGTSGGLGVQSRWEGSFHRFTWASGIEAMHHK